jgi:hypothetical protein
VTAVHPREHCSVTVRYIVQGRNYEQSFAPYGWNMGANVTVYYQANHPDNAELADPREILENNILLCAFSAIFCPSIILASARFSVPQLTTTVIVAFTIISIGIEAYQGNIHGPQWISAALILAGVSCECCAFLTQAGARWPIRIFSSWVCFWLSLDWRPQFNCGLLSSLRMPRLRSCRRSRSCNRRSRSNHRYGYDVAGKHALRYV